MTLVFPLNVILATMVFLAFKDFTSLHILIDMHVFILLLWWDHHLWLCKLFGFCILFRSLFRL